MCAVTFLERWPNSTRRDSESSLSLKACSLPKETSWAGRSVWYDRRLRKAEAAGSNPARSTETLFSTWKGLWRQDCRFFTASFGKEGEKRARGYSPSTASGYCRFLRSSSLFDFQKIVSFITCLQFSDLKLDKPWSLVTFVEYIRSYRDLLSSGSVSWIAIIAQKRWYLQKSLQIVSFSVCLIRLVSCFMIPFLVVHFLLPVWSLLFKIRQVQ